ncbi:uncharacterized protein N7483_000089 [Penicillium malachiteum]|uniref:uncharacterized protein n=1 Tax=Penicillium malachiteum TaxID=1324776 RepID=UPI00254660F5|nr:uncharacterized protein N7483_000089 [Penicillium malachiteum]KAJ5734964.1 hypothetical protein N7483_000089 [Penicillium malachiteum]
MVEQFFLDLTINDVLDNAADMGLVEPWASMYVSAIREKRYGDAIWARYHIWGQVQLNGIIKGTDKTVLDMIEEDAIEARVGEPEMYEDCLAFYAKTSAADGHPETIGVLRRIRDADYDFLKMGLEEHRRATESSP